MLMKAFLLTAFAAYILAVIGVDQFGPRFGRYGHRSRPGLGGAYNNASDQGSHWNPSASFGAGIYPRSTTTPAASPDPSTRTGAVTSPYSSVTISSGASLPPCITTSTAAQQSPQSVSSSYRFYNNASAQYLVESLPDVSFDVGEMYAGLVPINMSDTSRALFFVFQPTIGEPVDEITVWLQGGPGCSSLFGFLQENGRFVWYPGTYLPVENPYSWVNLTNMLWVEYPVGTGFSIGTPTASSEEEIAQDFLNFFGNFQQLFGISNFKIFMTGESYAGRYVPYIAGAMVDRNDTVNYDISGALIYDPVIGTWPHVAEEVFIVPFTLQNNNIFGLNESFLTEVQNLHLSCGYADYLDKYFVFPPSGEQPPTHFTLADVILTSKPNCDIIDLVAFAASTINPCFNPYAINQKCPIPWDVLGFPTQLLYSPPGAPDVYFNRTDVKRAIHAPLDVLWGVCTTQPVLLGDKNTSGDNSVDSIQHVLPQVIEATNRVLVSNGDYDIVIMTNGTLLAIQNMTWNGALGFQSAPSTPIVIPIPDLVYADAYVANIGYAGQDGPQGTMGVQHYERGLMWAETYQSGHMQPEFQPRVSYRHLQWVLGRIDSL